MKDRYSAMTKGKGRGPEALAALPSSNFESPRRKVIHKNRVLEMRHNEYFFSYD